MVETPVLFITFVRPNYARISWDAIKAAQPKTLYFYSNKGRADKDGEIERNNEIREYINEIDWECNLHTWFRKECVDIYTSLLDAKKWAFETEDSLIMLEEDCVASIAFFEFCDHFLKVYKDDKRINFVTGNNYAIGYKENGVDHYITRSIHHHGWATWKDRWESINWDILPCDVIGTGDLKKFYHDDLERYLYFKRLYNFNTDFIKRTKCWDLVKVLNQIKSQTYAITPLFNLVQNVGINGTHEINSGDRLQFRVSNNAEIHNYPFTGYLTSNTPNHNFDKAESKAEGHRCLMVRYLASNIYQEIKKLFLLLFT